MNLAHGTLATTEQKALSRLDNDQTHRIGRRSRRPRGRHETILRALRVLTERGMAVLIAQKPGAMFAREMNGSVVFAAELQRQFVALDDRGRCVDVRARSLSGRDRRRQGTRGQVPAIYPPLRLSAT